MTGTNLFSAKEHIAFASGCSLFDSRAYAMERSRSLCSISFSVLNMSVTFGSPVVSVPVLSTTTIWVLPVLSIACAVLYSIPCLAPTLFPTMMAAGAASPSAAGQLTIRTLTALESANPNPMSLNIHTANVMMAVTITRGMKM